MEFILKWLGNPSTAMEWIGQGLAIVGLVAMIVSYLQTKRKNILLGKQAPILGSATLVFDHEYFS